MLLDPGTIPRARFVVVLGAASLLLPFALYAVRDAPGELGTLLTFYPGEEVLYDARRIARLGDFYRRYTELLPRLSLHGQHFPPGHATWLYAVGTIFGDSVRAVGVAVLVLFAGGMIAVYGALACRLDEKRARQGVLLCLASPAMIDFACTSMDAVFFAGAALSLWLFLLAFREKRSPAWAAAAGSALFVSILLSYSALPLGLFLLLVGLSRVRPGQWGAFVTLGIMGLCLLLLSLLLGWITEFHLLDHFTVARAYNEKLMTSVIGRHPGQLYSLIAYGNAAAFAIGCGIGLLGALALQWSEGRFPGRPLGVSVTVVLCILVFGNIHQMETERIWLYAIPWIAWLALDGGRLPTPALRMLLAAGLAQAWLMEVFLFTLW
jgi:hypothetical protein